MMNQIHASGGHSLQINNNTTTISFERLQVTTEGEVTRVTQNVECEMCR